MKTKITMNDGTEYKEEVEANISKDKFFTKDSGERVNFDSGAVRDEENNKIRYDLIFPNGNWEESAIWDFTYLNPVYGAFLLAVSGWMIEPQLNQKRVKITRELVALEPDILTRYAELLTRGAKKYTERNYELMNSIEERERAVRSLKRHTVQYCFANILRDDDEDHAAAILFNLSVIVNIDNKME